MRLVKIDWNPDRRTLRWFAAGLLVLAVLAAAFSLWKDRGALKVLAGVLAGLGLVSLAFPDAAGKPVYKAWMGVSFVVSTVVSNVVIALIFFGLITPLGLVLRALGRDSLRLKRGRGSYWIPAAMPSTNDRYERLF
ncbi:MAG: hypothetical protein HY924_15490 [Elusimicrobia bacterium]|nr:hypothetical protein [Elusimicrobiota bacterium]